MYKVILINPNTPGNYRKAKIATANLGIAALASYLQPIKGCEVSIIDARNNPLTPLEAYQRILDIKPDMIGISLLVDESSDWTNDVLSLALKSFPSTHIVIGSYFPSLFPEKALIRIPQAHSVVIGEGEETLKELIIKLQSNTDWKSIDGLAYRDHEKTVILNDRRKLICNLDDLPHPTRYLADGDGQDLEVMLEGSRGCSFYCCFCAVRPFYGLSTGKALRTRSAQSILQEIQMLCNKYPKLQNFRFVDPDFIAPNTKDRAEEFAELLTSSGLDIHFMLDTRCSSVTKNKELLKRLKKAGLKRLYLGIESGSPKILKKMNKAVKIEENYGAADTLKEIAVDYSYGFMMITPWSTEEDIELNAKLLARIGRIEFRSLFHEMTLVPSTPAYKQMEKENKLIWMGQLSYYTYKTNSPKIEHFRRVGRLLQKNYNLYFGELAGYIYESNRQLRRLGDSAVEGIEKQVDRLFLSIFDACWNYSKSTLVSHEQDVEFVRSCYESFKNQFLQLLHEIDPSVRILQVPKCLPKYTPSRQV